jgi:cation-transporting ATPase E
MLKDVLADAPPDLADRVRALAAEGWRVLLLAGTEGPAPLRDALGEPALPPLAPLSLVTLRHELRPDAMETLAAFAALGIELKIISGDDAQTVAAVARQAGLTGDLGLVSGSELDGMSPAVFAETANRASIFGRVVPAQKERIIEALMATGRHVAMIGDGVNDVLALKRAQLGIAMKSGSAAARNIADMVLINDDFAPLSAAFREGHRVRAGMANAMFLFLSRIGGSIPDRTSPWSALPVRTRAN